MALSKNIRINDRKKVTSQTKGEGVQNVSESFACTNNISVYWIRVYLEQCDPQRLSLNTLCSGKRAKRKRVAQIISGRGHERQASGLEMKLVEINRKWAHIIK